MPGFLLHVDAAVNCFHLAKGTIAPTQARVLVSGHPIANISAQTAVVGCPFQVPAPSGTKPQPCVTVKMIPSTKVLVNNQPVALLTPATLCQSVEQIPPSWGILDG